MSRANFSDDFKHEAMRMAMVSKLSVAANIGIGKSTLFDFDSHAAAQRHSAQGRSYTGPWGSSLPT